MNPLLRIVYLLLAGSVLSITSCKKDPVIGTAEVECDPEVEIENDHAIEGYTDKVSYSPGSTIQFKMHSIASPIDVSIYRYGESNQLMFQDVNIACDVQNYNCRSYSYGCDWETTYNFIVPQSNWESGVYSAYFTNALGESSYLTFVVKSGSVVSKDILVLANTNTWQGYNFWSGQSFYKYELNEKIDNSNIISFHRPNLRHNPNGDKGHLVNTELHLLRWLEKNNYQYDLVADIDLHEQDDLLEKYKVLILNVHPEYWTLEMRIQLSWYLQGGGNMMYLGGNGIFYKVALKYDRIEAKKSGEQHTYTTGKGGQWRDIGSPESSLLGIQYTRSGYGTYAPYAVIDSSHWVFDGIGLANGQLIGSNSLNGGGASGHETDKLAGSSPDNTVLLAKGTNPDEGGASMVYYMNSGGGQVFSVGSISYTGSLAVDSAISQITKNVLDEFTK